MLGSPESPGYLAAKGKRDEAVAVATKLWGAKGVAQLGESAGAWPAACASTRIAVPVSLRYGCP